MPRQPKSDKRIRQRSTNWVFTLNNYTPEEIDALIYSAEPNMRGPDETSNVAFVAFSEERGGKKNTPHLQGFLQLFEKGILSFFNPPKVGHRSWSIITHDL